MAKRRQRRRGRRGGRKRNNAAAAATAAAQNIDPRLRTRAVWKRLAREIEASHLATESRRRNRTLMLKQYAGSHFSRLLDGTAAQDDDMPLNVFHNALWITVSNIVARNPVAEIDPTTTATLRLYSRMMAKHLSDRMWEMRYRDKERLCVLDAMLNFGVMRVGVEPSGDGLEQEIDVVDPGKETVWRISPDDYVLDRSARAFEEAEFEGHAYRTTRNMLESIGFTAEEIEQIPQWAQRRAKADGQAQGLSDSDQRRFAESEFVEFYDLTDVWLPPGSVSRSPMLVTLAGHPQDISETLRRDGADKILVRDPIEWDGPEGGPYHKLVFADVPDNPLGTPPAGFWLQMAKMVSALAAHIIDAESTRKDVVIYNKSAISEDEIDRIAEASHGATIGIEADTENIRQVTMGGASDRAQGALSMFMSLFSRAAGGADLLTGAPVSGAAGRDVTATEIDEVSQRLNQSLSAMEDRVHEHADGVVRDLAWHTQRNPLLDAKVVLRRAGVSIPLRLTREERADADYFDRNFRVRRGSMRRMTGLQQSRAVMQWTASAPPIAAQLTQMFGDAFDPIAFLKMSAQGLLDPEDLEAMLPDPELAKENALLAAMSGSGGSSAGGEQNAPVLRRPGIPGSPGQPNSASTGASSPNFDTGQNTQNTVQAVRGN